MSGVTWAPWVLQGLCRYRLGLLRLASGTSLPLCAEALPIGWHMDVIGLAGSMYSRATVSLWRAVLTWDGTLKRRKV